MGNLINWIKNHKSTTILILIVGFVGLNIFKSSMGLGSLTNLSTPRLNEYSSSDMVLDSGVQAPMAGKMIAPEIGIYPQPGYDQVSESSNRIVIQDSSLSLLVKNVKEAGDQILAYTDSVGGFMVNASYNDPDGIAFATLTVRVPTDKLTQALSTFRELAVKVTNENLNGTDVTEQYEDLDARLATLNTTKAMLESLLTKATTVQNILEVQNQLVSTQQQIDYTVGQQKAFTDNAKFTRVTIYLSTDELALPYAPDKAFRPQLVFKMAVRNLIGTLQWAAESLIWIGVFAVIWIPLIAIYIVYKNWRKRKNIQNKTTTPRT